MKKSIENSKSIPKRLKSYARKTCSVKTVKNRLPIIEWLPKYNLTTLIQDIIAGITVGLTAIPQGIAYAVVAGLSPEYGLYSGLVGGFVYLFFGSCKDITIGPTAIMAAITAKYVSGYSADFAVLAAFLAGIVELIMGILHLGFLVDFISQPVITGFTTASAIQIATSQLRSLLGLSGPSGNYFAESLENIIKNISTIQLWDSVVGVTTIVILLLLKRLGQGCSRTDGFGKQMKWFISLARNAVVVILGIIIAYLIQVTRNTEPLTLIGEIGSGLPTIKPPPFSTMIGNETYTFTDMLKALGPQSIVLPLVAILESVAIAKAFAGTKVVDATQEMMAIGLCNIAGSFVSSMPTTGSFTRTAINHASGVQTPVGGIFTGLLIFLALSLLTSTFYYIPSATLAGLIITAMFSMIDLPIFVRLWKNSLRELLVLVVTIVVCLFLGLEYGIMSGISLEACILLFRNARPKFNVEFISCEKGSAIMIPLNDNISYCAAEHVRYIILKAARNNTASSLVIIDGANLRGIDTTVASNLMSVVKDLDKLSLQVIFLNFDPKLKDMCVSVSPKSDQKFLYAPNALDLVDRSIDYKLTSESEVQHLHTIEMVK